MKAIKLCFFVSCKVAIYNRETYRAKEIRYEVNQKHLNQDIKSVALLSAQYKYI